MRAWAHRMRVLTLAALVVVPSAVRPAEPDTSSPSATLEIPQAQLTVGDPVVVRLVVSHPPGTLFGEPHLGEESEDEAGEAAPGEASGTPAPYVVDGIERIREDPVDPRRSAWEIRVRPFATGEVAIPEVRIDYTLPGGGESGTAHAGPATLAVRSVIEDEDTTPADIRGPWFLPGSLLRLLLVIAGLALLAVAGIWIARRYLRRRPVEPTVVAAPVAPAEPPWQRALRALEALLGERLPAQGRVKEFHVRLAEIVKRFLGEQHGFDALDRTTEEILGDLRRRLVAPPLAQGVRRFLEPCDLVKFAKHRPAESEIDETVRLARLLIESGRPVGPAATGAAA